MKQPTPVTFYANALALCGNLYLPEHTSDTPLPALIIVGPSPQVKEQAAAEYAPRLAAEGYTVLTFDFRNFGESAGEPRSHEDSEGKLTDVRAAVSFLRSRPEIDKERIGVIGICAGGGYALKAAAFDPRIKTFVGIAGFYFSPADLRTQMGDKGYREALTVALAGIEAQDQTGTVTYLAHVAPEGGNAVMAGGEPYEYYGTSRGQRPNYKNQLTVDTGYTILTLELAAAADYLTSTPALLIHGKKDRYASAEAVQAVYDRITGPKDITWLDTDTHIGFYDDPTYIDPAVAKAVAFLREHL